MNQPNHKPGLYKFCIEHTFDHPRERVWKAWEYPERFKRWMGPIGSTMNYCEIDFRDGGAARYSIEYGEMTMHGHWAFREIKVPEKIVAIVSFTDESHEEIIVHPGMPDWPLKILSTVTFTEERGKTKITVEWIANDAKDIERKTFEHGAESMEQGWAGTFERLEAFLAEN